MRILGIDPGLGITGYGVIEDSDKNAKVIEAGVIRSNSKYKIEKRLSELHRKVQSLIRELKPHVVVLEELYSHYKHPRTSIIMGHARGVIALAIKEEDVTLVSYPSTRVKKAITGRGHASKEQIQKTVTNLLQLKSIPEPVDITDALALALTHANVCMHDKNIS